jgi:hypothetical protein
MGKWFAVLLVCFGAVLPIQAQEESPAPAPAISYKMERNLLNRATINLSRARQLCYSARQNSDPNTEAACAQVDTATAQMQQVCDSAIAKGVTGAVGICNSLLRPQS